MKEPKISLEDLFDITDTGPQDDTSYIFITPEDMCARLQNAIDSYIDRHHRVSGILAFTRILPICVLFLQIIGTGISLKMYTSDILTLGQHQCIMIGLVLIAQFGIPVTSRMRKNLAVKIADGIKKEADDGEKEQIYTLHLELPDAAHASYQSMAEIFSRYHIILPDNEENIRSRIETIKLMIENEFLKYEEHGFSISYVSRKDTNNQHNKDSERKTKYE